MITDTMMSKNFISLVLGLDCNCQCSYCYQNILKEKCHKVLGKKDLDRVIQYIMGRYKENTNTALTLFGGEPLLYLDDIKYILSSLDGTQGMFKRIFTNAYLLTEEIVDLLNKYHVHVIISNDGEDSERVRGYNILKDKKIVRLIQSLDSYAISSVVYSGNEDVFKTNRYFIKYLPNLKSNMFTPMQVYTDTEKYVDDFDFDMYRDSMIKSYRAGYQCLSIFGGYRRGFATFTDGSIMNLNTNTLVGKIDKDGIRHDFDVERELRKKSGCLFEECEWYKSKFCCGKVYQIEDNVFCRKVAKVHKEIFDEIQGSVQK